RRDEEVPRLGRVGVRRRRPGAGRGRHAGTPAALPRRAGRQRHLRYAHSAVPPRRPGRRGSGPHPAAGPARGDPARCATEAGQPAGPAGPATGLRPPSPGKRRSAMSKVICDLTISADGYSAGPNQTEKRPFGDDGGDGWGNRLHAWIFETPEENRAEVDQMAASSAFVMGRNMFGPVRGEWDREWKGWWGDNPPFHAPVFVLTHYPR